MCSILLAVKEVVRLGSSVRANVEITVGFAVEGMVIVNEMHPIPDIGTDVNILITALVLSAGKGQPSTSKMRFSS